MAKRIPAKRAGMVPAQGAAVSAGKIPAKKTRRTRNSENPDYRTSKGYKEKIVAGGMDLPFFIIVMILLVMGIVMMFSASYAVAIHEGTDGLHYVKKQIFCACIGLVGMLIISHIDYHILRKAWIVYSLFGSSLLMLILVLILPNQRSDDFKRWIYIGTFSFQPSEIMKLAIIVLFAYIISVNYNRMKEFQYGILPFVVVLGIVAFLMIKEPHISGTVIICAIGLIMIFVGGANIKHFAGISILGAGGLVGIVTYLVIQNKLDHVMSRITSWLDPFADTAKDTWQTQQSLIAIGSGGLFGLGLGNSRQKYLYLPESENDFVFAVVCEELGFIGAMMVILLFALFIFRGFYIASKSPDKFGMMLVVGLTIQIGLQALLNIAVVTNTIPNTGISLPFFSYGGTALTMQLVQMGIILNVSRQSMLET